MREVWFVQCGPDHTHRRNPGGFLSVGKTLGRKFEKENLTGGVVYALPAQLKTKQKIQSHFPPVSWVNFVVHPF